MVKKILSRMEINRAVRRVMQQNSIDLILLNFSSSKRSVRLYGVLVKNTGKELEIKEVEYIMRAIESIPGVMELQCDFDNWNISAGTISAKGRRKKKKENEEEKNIGNATPESTTED